MTREREPSRSRKRLADARRRAGPRRRWPVCHPPNVGRNVEGAGAEPDDFSASAMTYACATPACTNGSRPYTRSSSRSPAATSQLHASGTALVPCTRCHAASSEAHAAPTNGRHAARASTLITSALATVPHECDQGRGIQNLGCTSLGECAYIRGCPRVVVTMVRRLSATQALSTTQIIGRTEPTSNACTACCRPSNLLNASARAACCLSAHSMTCWTRAANSLRTIDPPSEGPAPPL